MPVGHYGYIGIMLQVFVIMLASLHPACRLKQILFESPTLEEDVDAEFKPSWSDFAVILRDPRFTELEKLEMVTARGEKAFVAEEMMIALENVAGRGILWVNGQGPVYCYEDVEVRIAEL
jgi:hypothetical protein